MQITYTVAGRTIRQVRQGDAINFETADGLAGGVVATLFDGEDRFIFDQMADVESMFGGASAIDGEAFAAAGITPETARADDAKEQ